MSRANAIRLVITAASLVIFAFFLSAVDWSSVGHALRSSRLGWLIVAAGLTLTNLMMKGFRFQRVASLYGQRLTVGRSFAIQSAGIALGMVTPGRVGEAVKVSLLHDLGVPTRPGFGIVIFERIFDILILGFFALALPFTLRDPSFPAWVPLAFLAMSLVVLILVLNLRRLLTVLPNRLRSFLERSTPPADRFRLLHLNPIFAWTLAAWVVEALTQLALFRAVGANISLLPAIGVMAVSTLVAVVSLLPFGFGVLDLSLIGLYQLHGVSPEITVSFAATVRVVNTIFPIMLGLAALLFIRRVVPR